ncbi:MAG: hypothetical protein KAV87_23075 [Desulfobacteraceae bacterium]|nr:hypothetical protein [Desulfobacteraceae bacterium]
MNILSALRRRLRKDEEPEVRKQFNWTINREIGESVRFVAKLLQFPRFVVVEQALQIGLRQLLLAEKDPERRKVLNNHLEGIHLLGDGLPDDEVVLRLGELNDSSMILAQAQPFLKAFRDLRRAMTTVERTRDFDLYEKYKKTFVGSAIRFAGWLEQPNRILSKGKRDVQAKTSGNEKPTDDNTGDEE